MSNTVLILFLYTVVLNSSGEPEKQFTKPFVDESNLTVQGCVDLGKKRLSEKEIMLIHTDKDKNTVFKTYKIDSYKCSALD